MLLGLLSTLIFGMTLPLTVIARQSFSPGFISFGRATLAGLLAAAILLLTRLPRPRGRQWLSLAVVAAGIVFCFPYFSAIAMQSAPASYGGVILGILPVTTSMFGALMARERPSFSFWLLATLGCMLVVGFAILESGRIPDLSNAAIFFAVIGASIGYTEGAKLTKSLGGWQTISWSLALSVPLAVVPFCNEAAQFNVVPSPKATAALIYLILMSRYFGFFLWYRALAIGGIARVSQTQLLMIFVTLGASALLLSEPISILTLVFAVLVVAVVILTRWVRDCSKTLAATVSSIYKTSFCK